MTNDDAPNVLRLQKAFDIDNGIKVITFSRAMSTTKSDINSTLYEMMKTGTVFKMGSANGGKPK